MSQRFNMDKITTTISYAMSAFLGGLGALTLEQWMALGALLLGAVTYLTNRHYKRKNEKRDQEKHAIHMEMQRVELELKRQQLT